MTREIDPQQSPLWVRSELVRVNLIHLITYSDREAETEDEHFYFSQVPALFDYANTGTDQEFWPVLQSVGSLTTSMNHLSSPGDSQLARMPWSFTLANAPYVGDERLAVTLRDGHTLEGARVEWTQVALDARWTGPRVDLSALDGDEHVERYFGRVLRVGPISGESITFACEIEIPDPVVLKALDSSKNAPDDYGKRLPIVYGEAKKVRAIAYDAGWSTSLGEAISDSETGTTLFTDLSGATGTVTFRIDDEEIAVTWVDDTSGSLARAQNGTTAAAHRAGTPALEQQDVTTYILAGHPCSAVQELYMRSPATGELFRLDSSIYGFTLTPADLLTIPGEVVCSVSFTKAQLQAIYDDMFAAANPEFEETASTTVNVPLPLYFADLSITGAVYSGVTVSESVSAVTFQPGASNDGVGLMCPEGMAPSSSRIVARWRFVVSVATVPDDSKTFTVHVRGNFFGDTDIASFVVSSGSSPIYNITIVSDWITPGSEYTIEDMERAVPPSSPNNSLEVYLEGAGTDAGVTGGAYVYPANSHVEVEVVPEQLTRIVSAPGGGTPPLMELWGDIDGYLAPTASPVYKAGAGNLMTQPCDIMRHWIQRRPWYPVTATISATELETDRDQVNRTSYDTGSISPSGDITILCAVLQSVGDGATVPNTPTLSGCGLSWTEVASVLYDNSGTWRGRVTLFRASGASPTPGALTIDCGGQTQGACVWSIHEFPGTDTTTDDGVVQFDTATDTANSLTVTLGAFDVSTNATYGAFGHTRPNVSVPGSGFTTLYDRGAQDFNRLHTIFKNSADTSVDSSHGGSALEYGGIAVELAATQQTHVAPVYVPAIHSDSYDDCATNLDDNAWGFDARTLGYSWEEILARMAYEARANVVPEPAASGIEWRMLTALSTYHFAAASGSITEWAEGGFIEADQDVAHTHASRFTFPYAPDWSKGDGEEAFTGLVVANEDVNDLTTPNDAAFIAAAAALGAYEAEPMAFKCIREEATAREIAGWYAHERATRIPARLIAIREIPWWEGHAVQRGDILNATPEWEDSPLKLRVLEYTKEEGELIELRLVEVE